MKLSGTNITRGGTKTNPSQLTYLCFLEAVPTLHRTRAVAKALSPADGCRGGQISPQLVDSYPPFRNPAARESAAPPARCLIRGSAWNGRAHHVTCREAEGVNTLDTQSCFHRLGYASPNLIFWSESLTGAADCGASKPVHSPDLPKGHRHMARIDGCLQNVRQQQWGEWGHRGNDLLPQPPMIQRENTTSASCSRPLACSLTSTSPYRSSLRTTCALSSESLDVLNILRPVWLLTLSTLGRRDLAFAICFRHLHYVPTYP